MLSVPNSFISPGLQIRASGAFNFIELVNLVLPGFIFFIPHYKCCYYSRPDYAALNPRKRVNGDTEEKAKSTLKDTKLLQLFKAVESMNENDKYIITELISTFTFQRETQRRLVQQ